MNMNNYRNLEINFAIEEAEEGVTTERVKSLEINDPVIYEWARALRENGKLVSIYTIIM